MGSMSPFADLQLPTPEEEDQMMSVIAVKNCESVPGDDYDKMLFGRRIEECQHQLRRLLRRFDSGGYRVTDDVGVTLIIIPTRQHEPVLMTRNRCRVKAPIDAVVDESFKTRQSSQTSEDFDDSDEPRPFAYRERNEILMTFEIMLSRITEEIGGGYHLFIIPESRRERLYSSCDGQELYLGDDPEALRELIRIAVKRREEASRPQPITTKEKGRLTKAIERLLGRFEK